MHLPPLPITAHASVLRVCQPATLPLPLPTLCRSADIVLNVESEQAGGMRTILQHLLEFFKAHPGEPRFALSAC